MLYFFASLKCEPYRVPAWPQANHSEFYLLSTPSLSPHHTFCSLSCSLHICVCDLSPLQKTTSDLKVTAVLHFESALPCPCSWCGLRHHLSRKDWAGRAQGGKRDGNIYIYFSLLIFRRAQGGWPQETRALQPLRKDKEVITKEGGGSESGVLEKAKLELATEIESKFYFWSFPGRQDKKENTSYIRSLLGNKKEHTSFSMGADFFPSTMSRKNLFYDPL